jgi:antitoxin HicB
MRPNSQESKTIFPAPEENVKGRNICRVTVDPKTAFAQTLRMTRIKKGLTQKEAADLIGMKNIYSYQRLESSKKANPALLTIARLKEVFPELKIGRLI